MNERLVYITGEVGQDGVTLSTGALLIKLPPIGMKMVYASFHTTADTATATVNIQDDGTDVIASALDAAAGATTPVEWNSKHFRGTYDPVLFAGGSVLEIDTVNFAASQRLQYLLAFLAGGN
jgi:hypothetical protein